MVHIVLLACMFQSWPFVTVQQLCSFPWGRRPCPLPVSFHYPWFSVHLPGSSVWTWNLDFPPLTPTPRFQLCSTTLTSCGARSRNQGLVQKRKALYPELESPHLFTFYPNVSNSLLSPFTPKFGPGPGVMHNLSSPKFYAVVIYWIP